MKDAQIEAAIDSILPKISENHDGILDKWLDAMSDSPMPNSSGAEALVTAIGYADMSDFLNDNPGASQSIVQFVDQYMTDEWAANLRRDIGEAKT